MRRSLTLAKESLTELTPADLASVAGAAPWTPSCPMFQRIQDLLDETTIG